ncbi:MAG: methylated-DNA--[protein]-cysteine S-methyltransferase [Lachnospiraceae bacterium]|nr:methylated-DNA--[protein]-cysteine S-methyltransferase [Lachnospiraceae bacterium]
MEYTYHYASPLGGLTLESDGQALTGLWFEGPEYAGPPAGGKEDNVLPVFTETVRWLDIYFSGKEPDFTPPLSMRTTPFRQAVWEIMLTIPYGQTMSYGEIARRIAERRGIPRMAAQAVGGAVGHNAISIIIPCHRVIGADGDLTGYGGGLDKKIKLLELEKADISSMFLPKKSAALP